MTTTAGVIYVIKRRSRRLAPPFYLKILLYGQKQALKVVGAIEPDISSWLIPQEL